MHDLFYDLRFALRVLRKQPLMTAAALLTLTLGIGANTAIFSVVHGVLLRPLPFADPAQIVQIWGTQMPERDFLAPLSRNEAVAYAADTRAFQHLAAYSNERAALRSDSEPEQVRAMMVSAGFFEVFGVEALLGRTFAASEDAPGKDAVVVLSHGLWQRRFGATPGIVGQTLEVAGRQRTVIGVAPPEMIYPRPADLWLPLAIDPTSLSADSAKSHGLGGVGRLRVGTSLAQGEADLNRILGTLEEAYPDAIWDDATAMLVPLREQLVGPVRPTLLALLGAVALLLLLACANVANLFLARAEGRRQEIAIRAALGGGRRRIVCQLLTEGLVLASIAGVLGVLFTLWGLDAFLALAPSALPRAESIAVDGVVLGFTAGICLLTTVIFGLLPAWQVARTAPSGALRSAERVGGGRRQHARSIFVVAEVAVALVLLIGAGLMVRSLGHLLRVDPGLDPEHLLTAKVQLPEITYPAETQVTDFYSRLLTALGERPEIAAAGAVSWFPFADSSSNWVIEIDGRPVAMEGPPQLVDYALVAGDYFRAAGIPVLRGRGLIEADRTQQPGIVITRRTAELMWPQDDPLGQRIRLSTDPTWRTIVGIVGDHKNRGLAAAAEPGVYIPLTTVWTGDPYLARDMTLALRTRGAPAAAVGVVRAALTRHDPRLPLGRVLTMEEILGTTVAQPRFTASLLGLFALCGLLLGAVGVYGVIAYWAAQSTREIGIRMALGARRGDVMRLILGRGTALVTLGAALGLAAGYGTTRLAMSSLLFAVDPGDPLILAGTTGLLLTVALTAGLLPARRAARVDPIVALRQR